MSDKSERIFQSLSDISDQKVDEAARRPAGKRPAPRWRRWTALAACLSLCYALAIPYLPEQFPRYADLHVILAALACVLLMLALLVALLALYRRQPDRYVPLLRAWFIIVGICGVLFLIPQMVSSALEVFFTISAALLVRKAWLYRR